MQQLYDILAQVPNMSREDYYLVNVSGGFLELMDQAGKLRGDIRLPQGSLGQEIEARFHREEDLQVTILSSMGQHLPISIKAARF